MLDAGRVSKCVRMCVSVCSAIGLDFCDFIIPERVSNSSPNIGTTELLRVAVVQFSIPKFGNPENSFLYFL